MALKNKEENTPMGVHNTMAPGTTVKGNVFTETDFRLDGIVEGDVSCKGKLVIGPKGKVIGNILSVNAEILGIVEGTIKISGKLVVKSSAKIKGEITTQILEIEPNAHFNGTCSMQQEKPVVEAPKGK